MYRLCLYCKKAIDEKSAYCSFCGRKQTYGGNGTSGGKWTTGKGFIIFALIVAALWYFGNNKKNETNQSSKITPTPFIAKITAVPATVRPNMPMPPNGDVTKYTYKAHEAPFEVVTPSRSDYYYVVLTESTDIKLKVVSLIVHPGETAEIMVPLGSYKMFYATGEKWYGKFDLFGEETRRYQADDVLRFYVSGDQIMGHTIELIKQLDGNLETFAVDEENFPI